MLEHIKISRCDSTFVTPKTVKSQSNKIYKVFLNYLLNATTWNTQHNKITNFESSLHFNAIKTDEPQSNHPTKTTNKRSFNYLHYANSPDMSEHIFKPSLAHIDIRNIRNRQISIESTRKNTPNNSPSILKLFALCNYQRHTRASTRRPTRARAIEVPRSRFPLIYIYPPSKPSGKPMVADGISN